MNFKKIHKVLLGISSLIFICVLLSIVYLIQVYNNRDQAEHTAAVLINQVESTIDRNKEKENKLLNSLKEDYTVRAKSISYILDRNPEIAGDVSELNKIAQLTKVDEIHIMDETGTIFGGSHPKYYGYSMDSGEQMAYFKPMLTDKSLSMCQDLTPNTAEGKQMMYAICWNESGTQMLQVGIAPKRLMEELRVNDIYEVVQGMPTYRGIIVVVADGDSGEIRGATTAELVGQKLSEIGVEAESDSPGQMPMKEGVVNGQRSYYTVHEHGTYFVAIIQQRSVIDEGIPYVLGIITVYIFAIAAISFLMIVIFIKKARREKERAVHDVMTGLLNRRAYEASLQSLSEKPVEENFVYVAMDLNSLKQINDTFGHAAGDEMIKAAASCMTGAFGKYGKLFRIGGDEFAAMIYADEKQLEQIRSDFEEATKSWHGEFKEGVSVSCGYVRGEEFPEKTLEEMVEIADKRMYLAKEAYYRVNDRRKPRGQTASTDL